MKLLFTTIIVLCALAMSHAQMAGLGFFNLKYGTIGEEFIDATSEGFSIANDDIQLNESGIGLGGNGLFLFNKFSVGGGGSIVFVGSDVDQVKMNVGSGYGTFGYNFVFEEDLMVNVSARLGGFGNTLTYELAPSTGTLNFFGDYLLTSETTFSSGSFLYGAEVNVIKMFPSVVPGLAVGLTAYFMAPFTSLEWQDENDVKVNNIEEGEYIHFGVSLKIGGGAIFR